MSRELHAWTAATVGSRAAVPVTATSGAHVDRSAGRGGGGMPFAPFLAIEIAIWAALYAVYFVVRGQTISGFGDALANARTVVEIERVAGLDHERLIQEATQAVGAVEAFLAQYYEFGFFPVIITGLILLAYRDRPQYREVRTTMMLSIAVATVVFAMLPTAPPRLVPGLGLADTVGMNTHDVGSIYGVPYNPYAAMPSMHVGWTILLAIGLFNATRSRRLRVLIVAHPFLMSIAVVATGNHYLLDGVVGAAIALGALALVRRHARAAPDRVRRGSARPQACMPTA